MSNLRALLKELVAEILDEAQAGRPQADIPASARAPMPPTRATAEPAEGITVTERLLTERAIKRHAGAGQKTLCIAPRVVVTPLAREAAHFMGVTLKQLDRR